MRAYKKHTFLLVSLLFIGVELPGQKQMLTYWSTTLAGINAHASDVVVAGDGSGYMVAGTLGTDAGLFKFSHEGVQLWARNYGGSEGESFRAIVANADGSFVMVGTTSSNNGDITDNNGILDVWVVKVDAAGDIIWQHTYGGWHYDYGRDIQRTPDGGYIIAATTDSHNNGDVTGNSGPHPYWDMWLVKLNAEGEIEWQRGNQGNIYTQEQAFAVVNGTDGGYCIAGWRTGKVFLLKVDDAGVTEWQNSYGGTSGDGASSVIATSDGGYLVGGHTNSNNGDVSFNNGGQDGWLIKVDQAGELEWEITIGTPGQWEEIAAVLEFGGEYRVLGHYHIDLLGDVYLPFLANVGPAGQVLSVQNFREHGTLSWGVQNMSVDSEGDVLITSTYWNGNGQLTPTLRKINVRAALVRGTTFWDLNGNASLDPEDLVKPFSVVRSGDPAHLTFSDQHGDYQLSFQNPGEVTVGTVPHANIAVAPVQHTVALTSILDEVENKDFAHTPIGENNDLAILITPLTFFRPGFAATYRIRARHKGLTPQPIDATVTVTLDDLLDFTTADPAPTDIAGNVLQWEMTLQNLQVVDMLVHVGVDTSAPLGTVLLSSAGITSVIDDLDPHDNYDEAEIVVTGSYDPNDIHVDREEILLQDVIDQVYLDYRIRFQNTGTDTAFVVKIKNPVPEGIDLSTFELLDASHTVELDYDPLQKVLWFQFDNILLVDSTMNEPLSHGFVRYRVRVKDDLQLGAIVPNQVGIYFDFNLPVITNTATTEVILPTSINEHAGGQDVVVYPNPTSTSLTIGFMLPSRADVELALFSPAGQLLNAHGRRSFSAGGHQVSMPLDDLEPGLYLLRLWIDGQMITRKVLKM